MCNPRRPSYARSLRELIAEDLIKPEVPVADPTDGLIKTIDLETNIDVNVTVWEGAKTMDSIQLRLEDELIGNVFSFAETPIPGETVTLRIPVATELEQDGLYKLSYAVKVFPGGNDINSPATSIKVDRTPPGAHQLGYMGFPEEAEDGLTAAELSAMGDILPGQIYGYSGFENDDVIQTYWGEIEGPALKLSEMDDENAPITIPFEKAFLLSLPKNAGATYYTVTDRAGNTSAPSRKITIPLFLTEVTPGLPKPFVDDDDGLITYNEALARVQVKIPTSDVLADGDSITLYWGAIAVGPFPINPADIDEPYVLQFDLDYLTVNEAGNGDLKVRYEVIREGQTVGISLDEDIAVNIERPVPIPLEKPTIKGASSTPSAEDNVIDEEDFEQDATAIVNWNAFFLAGQHITLYWGGVEILEQPYTLTNSDVAASRSLLLKVLNSRFKPVGTGTDIRVYYTVTTDGNPNTSTSGEQGIIVRSKDELPGGPEGPDRPEFLNLNENGAINLETAKNGLM